jgi:hypothetical protein
MSERGYGKTPQPLKASLDTNRGFFCGWLIRELLKFLLLSYDSDPVKY